MEYLEQQHGINISNFSSYKDIYKFLVKTNEIKFFYNTYLPKLKKDIKQLDKNIDKNIFNDIKNIKSLLSLKTPINLSGYVINYSFNINDFIF